MSTIASGSATPVPAPKPLPAVKKPVIDPTTALNTIRDELTSMLQMVGQNPTQMQAQIDKFMQQINPVIQQAITDGDLTTLRYTKDQIAAHLGRVSLGFLYSQQQLVTNTVVTTLSLLIKVGIGALVAAA